MYLYKVKWTFLTLFNKKEAEASSYIMVIDCLYIKIICTLNGCLNFQLRHLRIGNS
jgi:hypothetical protein